MEVMNSLLLESRVPELNEVQMLPPINNTTVYNLDIRISTDHAQSTSHPIGYISTSFPSNLQLSPPNHQIPYPL